MQGIVSQLRAHFDPLADRMETFARHGVQTEGWFKGELLLALDRLAGFKVIRAFDREVQYGGKRIDLVVESERKHWVELKHWLIGFQKGTKYGAGFYLRDPSSVGIGGDVSKLMGVHGDIERWLLVLMAANPGEADWNSGVRAFNLKFAPRRIESCSNPSDYPAAYFLGLLRVLPAAD